MTTETPGEEVLTAGQAAEALGLTRQRVHQLALAGLLPFYLDPASLHRRFPARVVEQFRAEREASLG